MAPRPDPSWAADTAPQFRPCGQRILVVTDGLNYNPNDGFGLTVFLRALSLSGTALTRPRIRTAHRFSDAQADVTNFVFDDSQLFERGRRVFDQLWLFGFAGTTGAPDADGLRAGSIQRGEIAAIERFMSAGGGVFATGDHLDMGDAMCGSLPRIRKMRDWRAVPMDTRARLDTVVDSGADDQFELADQSDDVPQRIYPHYYQSGGSWFPHPLLRSDVDIDVLPDHPHESECLPGRDLAERYTLAGLSVDEFPLERDGDRVAPEVVATSVSGGRLMHVNGSRKPPVVPRCFGAISVYDGRTVGPSGRIVCDATWHHFVNINLDGTGGSDRAGRPRHGLRDSSGFPTADLEQIFRYYRNIADWLAPTVSGRCSVFADLVMERATYPLIEEWRSLETSASWSELVGAGALVEDALTATHGRGKTVEVVWQILEDLQVATDVVDLLRPSDPSGDERKPVLVPPAELRMGVLGGIFDEVAKWLPADPYELPKAFVGVDVEELSKTLFSEGVGRALRAAGPHYGEAAARTSDFAKLLAG